MHNIRRAKIQDLPRIAEILVFNYRMYFYPIFQNDFFYFEELQVPKQIAAFESSLDHLQVYDDGVVKGFIQIEQQEVRKLFVEPVLQGKSIGGKLLDFAIAKMDVKYLWVLEKNTRAIAFYERHDFHITGDRMPEEGTEEYLVRMER